MDIVAAGRFAPDYLLGRGFELREADGAVAVDGFAFAGVVLVASALVVGTRWRVLEDFAEFLVAVSAVRSNGGGEVWRTEEMNASWYCKCSGAFKTLCRT